VREEVLSLGGVNRAFGLELYGEIAKEPGNLFFSPLSVSEALVMAYAGALGDTAVAFESALDYPLEGESLLALFGHLKLALSRVNDGEKVVLKTGNSLWVDEDFQVSADYASSLDKFLDGAVFPADFQNGEPIARGLMNDWVGEATEGKMTELFSSPLDPATRVILANAAYFKGAWAAAFDPALTSERPFHLGDGKSQVTVPFMERLGRYGFFANEDVSVLELPYGDGEVSMFVFLPAKTDKAKDLILAGNLDPDLFATLMMGRVKSETGGFVETEVRVAIPKFALTWGTESLKEALGALGLSSIFVPGADFEGIAPEGGLFFSDFVHKANVEVTEEGTVAAAATGGVVQTTSISLGPREFVADRPFFFAIRENATKSLLFLGRLSDPSGG
jgi:serpin B